MSAFDAESLDANGFVILHAVLDEPWLAELRDVVERGEESPGGTVHTQVDLAAPPVQRLITCPAALQAARQVTAAPFRLFAIHARAPTLVNGRQKLHADWTERTHHDDPFAGITVLWLLDAFESDNGATRVVPGTHRQARQIPRQWRETDSHPDEHLVVAPAGSALVFNCHLWHAGTENESGAPRRVIQSQYIARSHIGPHMHPPSAPDHAPPEVAALLR